MKKIRFQNPIRECMRIQGKAYTISLIIAIAALLVLSVIAASIGMNIITAVAATAAVATIAYYGWWFGVTPIHKEEE